MNQDATSVVIDADYRLADCPSCAEGYDHVRCLNCERDSQVTAGDDTCPQCLAPTLRWEHDEAFLAQVSS